MNKSDQISLRSVLVRALWVLVVFVISFLVIHRSVSFRSPSLSGDEIGNAAEGEKIWPLYLHEFLLKGDAANPEWREYSGGYGSPQPRVAVYVFGLLIDLSKKHSLPLRSTIGFVSAAAVAVLFLLVFQISGLWAGLFASLLCLANPTFRLLQVAFMHEVPLVLFTLAALLFLSGVETTETKFRWACLVFFGIFAGLSISCKLSGFAVFITLFFLVILRLRDLSLRIKILAFISPSVIAFLIFYLTNPLLIQDFWFGISEMTTNRVGEVGGASMRFTPASLRYILTYPMLIIRPVIIDDSNIPPLYFPEDLPYIALGYALLAGGVFMAFRKKKILPLLWLLSTFLLQGFYAIIQTPGSFVPRIFILPSLAVVILCSMVLDKTPRPTQPN